MYVSLVLDGISFGLYAWLYELAHLPVYPAEVEGVGNEQSRVPVAPSNQNPLPSVMVSSESHASKKPSMSVAMVVDRPVRFTVLRLVHPSKKLLSLRACQLCADEKSKLESDSQRYRKREKLITSPRLVVGMITVLSAWQFSNMLLMSVTLEVSSEERSMLVRFVQTKNMPLTFVTFGVLTSERSMLAKLSYANKPRIEVTLPRFSAFRSIVSSA